MSREKIIRTETAEVLLFDLDPESSELKIGLGVSFCMYKGRLCVSESPFLDLNLSVVQNVTIENDSLQFDTQFSEKDVHFIIKPACPGANALMQFIKYIYENPLIPDKSFKNSIYLQSENGELLLRLEELKANNRILITSSKIYGNHLIQRFPEPSKRYKILVNSLADNILTIKCEGHDLYQDQLLATNNKESFTYSWSLNFQPETLTIINQLILANIELNF